MAISVQWKHTAFTKFYLLSRQHMYAQNKNSGKFTSSWALRMASVTFVLVGMSDDVITLDSWKIPWLGIPHIENIGLGISPALMEVNTHLIALSAVSMNDSIFSCKCSCSSNHYVLLLQKNPQTSENKTILAGAQICFKNCLSVCWGGEKCMK
jgi:hypothetical protein